MIKTFITSEARRTILKYFYGLNKDKSPYVREIVRKTNLEINAVRRELIRLKKGRFLIEEPRGNRLHYKVNTKHIYYYDLARIFAKEIGIGKVLRKNKKKLGNINFCAISLKFFLNEEPRNPVDILIVGNIYLSEIKKIIKNYEQKSKKEVNYMVVNKEEFKILKDRKDPLLSSAINQPKSVIIGEEFKYLS